MTRECESGSESGWKGEGKKENLESNFILPGNLSQIITVISKLQIKAVHQPLDLKTNRAANL